jgi:hypothetical protein
MKIPGVPGASEPAFRTRDARWMGLDTLVQETCTLLAEAGIDVSLVAAKAAIQVARSVVQGPDGHEADALISVVTDRLRGCGVLLPSSCVKAVLTTYARVIVNLEVAEINEFC